MNDILEVKNENNEKTTKEKKGKSKKDKIIIGLGVTTGILGVLTIGFATGYGITQSQALNYKDGLENVYQSNFYSLLDSVNNLENKLSKSLNASSSTYKRKTLLEASKNASEAEIAVASLPLSQSDIQDLIKMVNQISGFTSTLADKLVSSTLSNEEIETLNDVYDSVSNLKTQLNEFARRLDRGYSIIDGSLNVDSESNEFSRTLNSFKSVDVEYPTMIYDGPFSDSVVNSEVKGLKGNKVSKSQALKNVEKYFKNANSVEYESETTGRFETYNFRVQNSEEEILFVQVTQIEGNILTISGAGEDGSQTIDKDKAKQIGLDFARENGIEEGEVVWSDIIANDIYFNIAPTSNGIILYPDLVKVKVNLVSGTVVGYDATSYFTNHTERKLSKGDLSYNSVSGKIPSTFELIQHRIVLSPLDYNKEVVCMEIEAEEGGTTYYFYFNVENGDMENILKVIKTDNGNLLM